MRRNRTSDILAIFVVLIIVNAGVFYFVPFERVEVAAEIEYLGIVGYLTIPYHLLFTPRSFSQAIDIAITCSEGTIDLVVLNSNEWGNWYIDEDYSAYYEIENASVILTTIDLTTPYEGAIDIIIQTNYGDVVLSGVIEGHSMAYNEPIAIVSLTLAIPFIVGWISYMITIRKDEEGTMMSTELEPASPV